MNISYSKKYLYKRQYVSNGYILDTLYPLAKAYRFIFNKYKTIRLKINSVGNKLYLFLIGKNKYIER